MKKYSLFSAVVLLCITMQAQGPNGAFKINAAQYGDQVRSKEDLAQQKVIKVFKDGYWMTAFFGGPQNEFSGSGGGTYTVKDGKYIENLSFFSWDSTAVGKTYTFDYTLTPTLYTQQGYINSDRYQNYLIKEAYEKVTAKAPLKNAALEGVWEITDGLWTSGKLGEGAYAGMTGVKIYAYPMMVFGYYKPGTRQFVAAGGGTYQFDGKKLEETLEYFSLEPITKPTVYEYAVSLQGNNGYKQANANGTTAETWRRVKNQQ